ncbi:MAG: alpha-D-ribose 1-methylphosphonate 5-triphosphate diphosphatase [bacterium]|nr:alpha-D-ribose 1-methylphosphonate 5-triphosphate diphosphatase [bacterium]
MNRLVLRSTRVLCPEGIRPADVVIHHDLIEEVALYGTMANAIDVGRRLVTPGFIDLHSDAVEKEIEPRPGAAFPIESAVVELDKKLAMAGITTMFHAIAFNDESLSGQRATAHSAALIRAIHRSNQARLSVDNLIHARYELTSFSSVEAIKELITGGQVQLLSFMDHRPGQGQFKSLASWKTYHMPVYKLSDAEAEQTLALMQSKGEACMRHVQELADYAGKHAIPLASHDDDSTAKIEAMAALGVCISEFPLNVESSRHARQQAMATCMGAPNVVRGKSQSGNISARELISAGCCDFLCSDYHPTSMLQAVYTLARDLAMPLDSAFSFITSVPAAVMGLSDRGEISPGRLADLVLIDDEQLAKVVLTLKSGEPVYSSGTCLLPAERAA